jgi:hypothetical protein
MRLALSASGRRPLVRRPSPSGSGHPAESRPLDALGQWGEHHPTRPPRSTHENSVPLGRCSGGLDSALTTLGQLGDDLRPRSP